MDDLFANAAIHFSALRDAWVRKLYVWWEHYNEAYLARALHRPLIKLTSSGGTLGHWERTQRVIGISARHIESNDWEVVLDTLRHEMAHQFVDEVLQPSGETAHGPAFREACHRLRCEPAASADRDELTPQDDQTLRRIQKLLSMGSSPNENEAQRAMQKAHQLLVKYNIDLVHLDRERRFESRALGEIKGRHTTAEIWLSAILNRFFFVEVIWSQSYDVENDRDGTRLHLYGTRANLEMAEYVHDYLNQLLPRLWDDYREAEGIQNNRERQRYFAGVLEGFHTKLSQQEERLAKEDALVWAGDAALAQYYRYVNPHVQTRYAGGGRRSDAYDAGVAEGRNVSIRQPVGQSSGVRGLLGSA